MGKYDCDVCGSEFNTIYTRSIHRKKCHSELYLYDCKICGVIFSDMSGVLRHITKKHKDICSAEEYFDKYLYGKEKCRYDHCDELLTYNRFSGYYCNQQHYESQLDIRNGKILNYVCSICKSGFETIGGLQRHLTDIHSMNVDDRQKYYDDHFKKDDEGFCLWCGKQLKLVKDGFSEGYMKFCYNTECNVRWHNKNNDRHIRAGISNKETLTLHPEINNTRIEYYLNLGYSLDESYDMVSLRQSTFSLKKCKQKYGDEKGIEVFKERQDRWIKSYYDKNDEELQIIIKSKDVNKSVAEIKLIEYCGCEHSFMVDGSSKYVYDMRNGNKIVEYNGTYFHCDPRIYDEYYYNKKTQLFACEIWEKDENKIKYANDNGFEVLTIWEEDFINDEEGTLNKCKQFLYS